MLKAYHNMMEDVLEQEFDAIKDSLECCTCERCRNDILAYALNQVSPRYVVTHTGGLMSKLESLRMQQMADLRGALMRASMQVANYPRHDNELPLES